MNGVRSKSFYGLAAVLVITLSSLSCLQPQVRATTQAARTRQAEAAETYARLVAHLAGDQMQGRGPDTKGIEKARDFLAGRFKAAGLRPAVGGSYLQPLELRVGSKVVQQSLALLGPDGKLLAQARPDRDFLSLGFSGSGRFEAEAVFVGYGIVSARRKYDSYAGAADAIKGKVVVAYRYEPQDETGRSRWGRRWSRDASLMSKARWAAERGAVAMLVTNPPSQGASPPPGGGSMMAFRGSAAVPVVYVAPELLKRMLQATGQKDADAAMRRFQAAADRGDGKPVVLRGLKLRGQVKLKPFRKTLHNVVAVLGGAGKLANQYIIVGAHYDHLGQSRFGQKPLMYPGADDNASGTAGVLMLAQWFAERAAASAPPASRRSIIFAAFAAEEIGLWGSRHMAGHLDELGIKAEQVTVMINMDMIGRLRNKKLSVWGVDTGDRLREIMGQAARDSGLDVQMIGSGVGPSDNVSFYRRKVPVLGFHTGWHGDVHTPRDTADKINAAGAVQVLAVVEAVLRQLWADPEPIVYKPLKQSAGQAYLGVLPDQTYDGRGCRLEAVVADGPAEKAGLADGDVIVAWDGKPITGLSALLAALRRHKAGDVVSLKVRRGQKAMDIKVTLGGP